MKTLAFLALLVVGISSSYVPSDYPEYNVEIAEQSINDVELRTETRFITDNIISRIEELSQDIVNAGLDPLDIKKESGSYALPVPVLFNAAGAVEEVFSRGLSNIVVNSMNFNLLVQRLNFDISLPHIHFSVGRANGEVTVFGNKIQASGDGTLDIRNIRVVGEVRVSVGIISGISVSRVTVDFRVGSIHSNIRLLVQDQNLSEDLNNFISGTIPDYLNEFRSEINELIEIILRDVINDNL